MKKEIEKLINSEEASLIINPFCTLYRWTKSALLEPADGLTATFHILSSADRVVNIDSRDWAGIVAAVKTAQEEFFAEIAKKLNSDLSAGYLYGSSGVCELITPDVAMRINNESKSYYTADRETGTFIDEFFSIEDAKKAIAEYEDEDKRNGEYTPAFYDIVNADHESIRE